MYEPTYKNSFGIDPIEYQVLFDFCSGRNIQSVLEFGPGESTKAFLNAGCRVTSIENDVGWENKLSVEYSEANIRFIIGSLPHNVSIHGKIALDTYDLAFVDGPASFSNQYTFYNRIDSYLLAKEHANIIIGHDTARPKDRQSIDFLFPTSEYTITEFPESSRGMTLIEKIIPAN